VLGEIVRDDFRVFDRTLYVSIFDKMFSWVVWLTLKILQRLEEGSILTAAVYSEAVNPNAKRFCLSGIRGSRNNYRLKKTILKELLGNGER
jgi:hypothetical protein